MASLSSCSLARMRASPAARGRAPRGGGARAPAPARASLDDEEPVTNRVLAASTYLLPLLDSLRFAGGFVQAVPQLSSLLLTPIAPIASVYFKIPLASLVAFFAIYSGIVNNRSQFSRFVRVNAMQSIVLDILLILPSLTEQLFRGASNNPIFAAGSSTVFLFVLISFFYASFACLTGRAVKLPVVGEAAESQVPM